MAKPNIAATFLGICLFAIASSQALAASHKGIEDAGTGVAIALPVIAGGISIYRRDGEGLEELLIDTGLTVGTAFALKHIVREQRPDHSDFHSFPSDTAALAFAPASYLWDRYGWEYGAPAYLAGAFVAYSRVDADKHHYWDVLASAAIAFSYSKLITTRFHAPQNLHSDISVSSHGAYVQLAYRW